MNKPIIQSNLCTFLQKHSTRLATIVPLWIDGGAYKGEFIDAALNLRSDLQFDAFEPQPQRARKLKKKYSNQLNICVHAKSLGDCNTRVPLYITAANTLSSTLPPLANSDLDSKERTALTETVQVEQVRLDFMLAAPPGLVKLDIQGMELAAVKGLGKLLRHTAALLVERSPECRYQGQPKDEDIHSFLTAAGFVLTDTLPHESQEAPYIYDALYFRDNLP